MSREDAASRWRAPAGHNDVEFERGGLRFKVRAADEVNVKLEIDEDERERD